MEALGGRYQSLSLKQAKGARRRIINEVAAWALNERGWPVSARRVKASWDHFRRIEREALSDLIDGP